MWPRELTMKVRVWISLGVVILILGGKNFSKRWCGVQTSKRNNEVLQISQTQASDKYLLPVVPYQATECMICLLCIYLTRGKGSKNLNHWCGSDGRRMEDGGSW